MDHFGNKSAVILAAAILLLMNSCATLGSSREEDRSAEAAEDQIMLVRAEPPSFGHTRLMILASSYPDLRVFLRKRQLPDFLAETTNEGRRYLILYYLDRKEAYACRTRENRRGAIEFAGPYPITEREVSLLSGFRREAARRHAAIAAAQAAD